MKNIQSTGNMMTLTSHGVDRYLPFSSQSNSIIQNQKKLSGPTKQYKSSVSSRTGTVLSADFANTN
jgi:hypothetical protein